jgi:diguanylate cyclase (GGDEF)-like protein
MERSRRRIAAVDPDGERGRRLLELIEAEDCAGVHLSDWDRALQEIYNDPPDLIILAAEGRRWKATLRNLKTDPVFGHLPVLALMEPATLVTGAPFATLPVDDFCFLPLDDHELRLRIRLAIEKAARRLDANPLSRLPGVHAAIAAVQQRIDEKRPFAFALVDIDTLQAFNDRYGFARGDEVIRMTARVLANTVRSFPDARGFVAHLGGDDFALAVDPSALESLSREALVQFDMLAPTFYDDADRQRGGVEILDRQGNRRVFPLVTLSIAAVCSSNHDFTHYGQFAAVATDVKKKVKAMAGSNCLLDRRCTKVDEPTDETPRVN